MPVVAAREGWSLRGGPSPPCCGAPAKGRRAASLCCRCSGRVVPEGRLKPSGSGCTGQGEATSLCRWWLLRMGGHLGEARAPVPRVHRPGGDGLPLRAGGRCSGGVVLEGRPKPSDCGCGGQGETGCLSVPVVAAREGWALRGGESPPPAGAAASGRWAASLCRWSLLGKGGPEGRLEPPCCRCTGQGQTVYLSVPVVAAWRVHCPGGYGLPLSAGGRCWRGGP